MKESISRYGSIELAPDARFRGVCGEGVVLNQGTAEVLVLNPVGLRVLELAEQDGSIAAVLSRLREEFDVEDAVLERDVLGFLREMIDAGAMRLSAGESQP